MIDILTNDSGDVQVGDNGDFLLVSGDEQIAQEVIFRLKTTKGDWILSPGIGCSLEDFIGAPNEDLVHSAIESRVLEALTFDDLLFFPDVTAISLSENEVLILVEFSSVEDLAKTVQIQSRLDMRKGLVYSRAEIIPS